MRYVLLAVLLVALPRSLANKSTGDAVAEHDAPSARVLAEAPYTLLDEAAEEVAEEVDEMSRSQSHCDCGWTHGGKHCGRDDGSHCWQTCCRSQCQCDWAADGCGLDDGSSCWRHCCGGPYCECSWAKHGGCRGVGDNTICWQHCCSAEDEGQDVEMPPEPPPDLGVAPGVDDGGGAQTERQELHPGELRFNSSMWPNGGIPFCFARDVSENAKEIVRAAAREFSELVPCVWFQELPQSLAGSYDYYSFTPGSWCGDGRAVFVTTRCLQPDDCSCGPVTEWDALGSKQRVLNLVDPACLRSGIVVHELGHALGVRQIATGFTEVAAFGGGDGHEVDVPPRATAGMSGTRAYMSIFKGTRERLYSAFRSILQAGLFASFRQQATGPPRSLLASQVRGPPISVWEMIWDTAVMKLVDITQLDQLYKMQEFGDAPPPQNGTRCLDVPVHGVDMCVQLSDDDCLQSKERRSSCCICGGGLKIECQVAGSNKSLESLTGKYLVPDKRRSKLRELHPKLYVDAFWKVACEERKISFKSTRGLEYIIVEPNGTIETGPRTGKGWEEFQEFQNADGTVVLMSRHGSFLAVNEDGLVTMSAEASWQERRFLEIMNMDGSISLMTHLGTYLCIEADGSIGTVRADKPPEVSGEDSDDVTEVRPPEQHKGLFAWRGTRLQRAGLAAGLVFTSIGLAAAMAAVRRRDKEAFGCGEPSALPRLESAVRLVLDADPAVEHTTEPAAEPESSASEQAHSFAPGQ